MALNIGVVMDPIGSINIKKDSTFAMMLEAQARGWSVQYIEQGELFLRDGQTFARMRKVAVQDDDRNWFNFTEETTQLLTNLDAVLMRKDPPFDMEYIYTTYLLEKAEAAGVLVVNKPQSLRDANEKLFTAWFPQCTPPTLVTRNAGLLHQFLEEHGDIILKPPQGMGGSSIFRLRREDFNTNVIIETLTGHESCLIIAQKFIPEISSGDKRILIIDGEPVPFALARIPPEGDFRGNLAVGAQGIGVELTDRDQWICAQVAPVLRDKGLLFVGLDVIGDYLTEINVTSPTCIRELDSIYSLNISALLMDRIEQLVVN
jgi:glutathione synthase